MAGSSLFALIDDIASLLDDVSVMTKVAAKKTAGVLGDDLALNAQQVSGVQASRELPVVWAVTKGSVINKLILVPAALLISYFAPWAITPLLMLGGAYLCFEGVEKLVHGWQQRQHKKLAPHTVSAQHQQILTNPAVDVVALEKEKIKGAIRTDFVLSAEIIVIALGSVATATFTQQVAVLAGIAALMTVGVYGLVALIVKLDDVGLWLSGLGLPHSGSSNSSSQNTNYLHKLAHALGGAILKFAPWLMKGLSVVGTAAMFLVGGGILVHGIAPLHHWVENLHGWGWLINGLVGVALGAVLLALRKMVQPHLK